MIWSISLTIQDASGRKARLLFYVEGDLADARVFANKFMQKADPFLLGVFTDVTISSSYKPSSTLLLRTVPNAAADVEEKAEFKYKTLLNTIATFTLSTWDDRYTRPYAGVRSIDLLDSGVNALVNMPLSPAANGAPNVEIVDQRGEAVFAVKSIKHKFKARKR